MYVTITYNLYNTCELKLFLTFKICLPVLTFDA